MNYGRKILNLFPWQADFTKKPIYFVCKVYCKVFSLCLQMVTRASLLDEECALWAKRGTVLPDVATEIKSFLKRAQRRTRGTVVYRNVQGCNEPMVAHGLFSTENIMHSVSAV